MNSRDIVRTEAEVLKEIQGILQTLGIPGNNLKIALAPPAWEAENEAWGSYHDHEITLSHSRWCHSPVHVLATTVIHEAAHHLAYQDCLERYVRGKLRNLTEQQRYRRYARVCWLMKDQERHGKRFQAVHNQLQSLYALRSTNQLC
jgi:hypothetical protein